MVWEDACAHAWWSCMQVLTFRSTDAWLTDVTLAGDGGVAGAMAPMHDARVHAQGASSQPRNLLSMECSELHQYNLINTSSIWFWVFFVQVVL